MHDAAPEPRGRFLRISTQFREDIVNILHGRHRALESALSITGIVAVECALVAGVLVVLHVDTLL
jgi:hypothetical protein